MKTILLALAVAAGSLSVAPAFAQDIDAMTCADFAMQDDAGKMATVAALQSATSQMQSSQTVMADDIFRELTTRCSGNDGMMLMEAADGAMN
jgi:hypothetical protein